MKRTDLICAVLFILILIASVLTLHSNPVIGQTNSSSSSGNFSFCIECALPVCSSGQVLSTPKDPCTECPKCIDVSSSSGALEVSSSSSGFLVCSSDSDCPKGICPDGFEYQSFECNDNACYQLLFFADPCLNHYSSSSSGTITITPNKDFTGLWRGRVNKTTLAQRFRRPVFLMICVMDGKLTGSIHIPKILESARITSQNALSENKVELTLKDKLNNNRTLTLELITKKLLNGTLDTGHKFTARKTGVQRNCMNFGSSSSSSSGIICPIVDCAAPPEGCNYIQEETSFGCSGCGKLVCSSSGGPNDCFSRSSCRGVNGEELPCPEGTFCSGLPAYGCYPPGCPVPICLSPDTRIKTDTIEKRVADIKVGDLVLTDGKKPVKVIKVGKTEVKKHKILKVTLSDATILEVSPGHPTSDGKLFKDLKMGDKLDGRTVVETKLIPYKFKYTYDILPDSKTGNYYANGILIGSTLAK